MCSNPDPKIHTRILQIMAHTTRYAFKGRSRLAADAGVSKSAVTRLINGNSSPSWHVLCALIGALERHTGRHLDPREVVSADGTYPTDAVCDLVGCQGCMPEEAYDADERLRDEYRGIRPGTWSTPPRADGKEAS